MIYYDYKINGKGESVCELIAETTKDSLVTCDFGVAPETEKVVQKILDSLTIKLTVKTVDNTPIFNFYDKWITLARYRCYNTIKLTIYLQFSTMKQKNYKVNIKYEKNVYIICCCRYINCR